MITCGTQQYESCSGYLKGVKCIMLVCKLLLFLLAVGNLVLVLVFLHATVAFSFSFNVAVLF